MTVKLNKRGLMFCPSCNGKLSPLWFASGNMGVHARLYGYGYCYIEGKIFKLSASEVLI